MKPRRIILVCILFILISHPLFAQQNHLQQKISISAAGKKLSDVLQKISSKGGFYFSYNSKIINSDSVINYYCTNITVKEALDKLFNNAMDYKEAGNYIILRKRIVQPLPPQATTVVYIIKGYIHDDLTGKGIGNATVFEKTKLSSALTNDAGFFTLKLKTKSLRPLLSISKENYYDTSIAVQLPAREDIIVAIQNIYQPQADTSTITIISPTDSIPVIIPDSTIQITQTPLLQADSTPVVEKTGLGKFVLSSKQKIQALNLSKFYTTRIYQLSLVPGLSTHGRLSSQVENIISLNVIGGYTGGTAAFEVGGVFNINRRNTKFMQAAGVFNITGGTMSGMQLAGVHNHVLANANGLQAAGVSSYVNHTFTGLQTTGVYNHVQDSLIGVQIAGVINYTGIKVKGSQIAGVGNIAKGILNGMQIAGVFNYAKKLNGLQIGIINIADSSNGYSIGIINFVRHGLHQISFSTNEITNTNIAFKMGNPHLYSILHAGYNFTSNHKVFSYGYGMGTVINPGRKLTIQPEILARYLYTGDWKNSNILSSFHLNLQANISKGFALYAAPVINLYYTNQKEAVQGYRFPVKPSGYPTLSNQDKVMAWVGFSAGISLF